MAHTDEIVYVSLSNGKAIAYNSLSSSFTDVWNISDIITSISVSSDTKTLLIGSSSGNVFVFDILHRTNKTIKIGSKAIKCIACGKNANKFAFTDGGCEIWEYSLGEKNVAYTGHAAEVEKICYSHDCTKLLSCSADNTIKEWSVEYKECSQTYSLHYDSVLWVEYSKSSNRFLSSSRDFAIREWNSKTGECEVGLIGLSYFMRSTQFDNNTGKVLSALCDGSIREWDIKTGNCINTYLGHKARVYSAIYDSTCTRILSASLDKSVYEWEVNNENMFTECGFHDDCVDSAAYIDDDNAMSIDSDGDSIFYKRWNGSLNKTGDFKVIMGNGILPNKTVGVNSLYYLSSSDELYIASWDQSIYRASIISKKVNNTLKHHKEIPCIMGIMVNGCTFNNITTSSPQYLNDIITQYGGVGL